MSVDLFAANPGYDLANLLPFGLTLAVAGVAPLLLFGLINRPVVDRFVWGSALVVTAGIVIAVVGAMPLSNNINEAHARNAKLIETTYGLHLDAKTSTRIADLATNADATVTTYVKQDSHVLKVAFVRTGNEIVAITVNHDELPHRDHS